MISEETNQEINRLVHIIQYSCGNEIEVKQKLVKMLNKYIVSSVLRKFSRNEHMGITVGEVIQEYIADNILAGREGTVKRNNRLYLPDIYYWSMEKTANYSQYFKWRIDCKIRNMPSRNINSYIMDGKKQDVTVHGYDITKEEQLRYGLPEEIINLGATSDLENYVLERQQSMLQSLLEEIALNFFDYFKIVNSLHHKELMGKTFKEEGERFIDERKILAYHAWLQATTFISSNPLFDNKAEQTRNELDSEKLNYSNTFNFHKELDARWEMLMPDLIRYQTDIYGDAFQIQHNYLDILMERVTERELVNKPFLKNISATSEQEKSKMQATYYRNSVDGWVKRIIQTLTEARSELKEKNEHVRNKHFYKI